MSQLESSIMSQYLIEDYMDTKITIKASAVTGSNLTPHGNFSSGTGWTAGTGWVIGSGVATHTTGNATSLTSTASLSLSPQIFYRYTMLVTTTTQGYLTISVGGITRSLLLPIATATTKTLDFIITGTSNLVITADSAWAGTLDNVTLHVLNFYNEDGILGYDEHYNSLSAGLIGTQSVFKCTKFNGMVSGTYTPFLLFHNSDNEILGMIKGTFDKEQKDYDNVRNNIVIKGQDPIYYKVNVGIEHKEFNGDSVVFSTLGSNLIFKVYLNGNDVSTYSRVGSTITFDTGVSDRFGNSCFIIFYPFSSSIGSIDIDLHYYAPYKHEVTENTYLGLGYELIPTATVSAGSNQITASATVASLLNVYDYIRLGDEVRKILYISTTTIKVDKIYESSYSGEAIYLLPYKFFTNIENEQETLSETFYEFETKGIKMPIKIKEKVSNKLTFDYKIDKSQTVDECNVYAYINDDIEKYIPSINKMRIIRTFYNDTDITKFIYLTNARKIESFQYTKGNPDKYNASFEFEDKLTLDMNLDYDGAGILGAGGLGKYILTRGN